MCNSQGWLPSAPGREWSHPKGPSRRQGWLEGSPGKALGCRQEGLPLNLPPALLRPKRAAWEEDAGAGGSSCSWIPHEETRTWLHFLWNQTRSVSFQRLLSVLGHYCFSAPGGVAADRLPGQQHRRQLGCWGGATSRCVLCCLQIQVTPWLPTSLSWRLVINNLTLHPPKGLSLGRFPALLWEQRGGQRRGLPGPISLSKN